MNIKTISMGKRYLAPDCKTLNLLPIQVLCESPFGYQGDAGKNTLVDIDDSDY